MRRLKNNYYFLVLQLAICDLGWLVVTFFFISNGYFAEEALFKVSVIYCLTRYLRHVFRFAGIYMMLMIAILRYHAAVHPLKHDISRRKLKVICCSWYILGLIVECGASVVDIACLSQRCSLLWVWKSFHVFAPYFKDHGL